jgi:hypothetical protein
MTQQPLHRDVNLAKHQQAYAQKHFFSSWAQLCSKLRVDSMTSADSVLKAAAPGTRMALFQRLAGKLSGSESAYFIWSYNLMGDDSTRPLNMAQEEQYPSMLPVPVVQDAPDALSNIHRLIAKKRKALPNDADYIEELERVMGVTEESHNNIESENTALRAELADARSLALTLSDGLRDMISNDRLTASELPDDFDWLAAQLIKVNTLADKTSIL